MIIVSNSSPLIALAKIEKLDIIKYNVVVPKAVFDEITMPKKEYVNDLYKWSKDKIVEVKNKKAVEYVELIVDRGETETIVLAEEIMGVSDAIKEIKYKRLFKEN